MTERWKPLHAASAKELDIEAVLGQVGAYEAADMDMPREIH